MKSRAFTLIELIVVMAIIVIVTSLAIPAVRGITGGNQLTSAASTVMGELNLARQTALSENREIEVRFFKLPDALGQAPEFRAMQRYRASDGAPLDKPVRLPGSMVMPAVEKFSTILSPLNGGTAPKTQELQGVPNVEYRAVRFGASGKTSLDPRGADGGSDRWFVTVANENDLRGATASQAMPAANFITIQIDPITGRLRSFQP